jgi:hypothetical protein
MLAVGQHSALLPLTALIGILRLSLVPQLRIGLSWCHEMACGPRSHSCVCVQDEQCRMRHKAKPGYDMRTCLATDRVLLLLTSCVDVCVQLDVRWPLVRAAMTFEACRPARQGESADSARSSQRRCAGSYGERSVAQSYCDCRISSHFGAVHAAMTAIVK